MLDGRVELVTGGGRGLGRAHCLELASHGAALVVNDLGVALGGGEPSSGPADEVVAEILAKGGKASADLASVSEFEAVGELIRRVVDEQVDSMPS